MIIEKTDSEQGEPEELPSQCEEIKEEEPVEIKQKERKKRLQKKKTIKKILSHKRKKQKNSFNI